MPGGLQLPLVSGRTSWEDRVRFTAALVPLLALVSFLFAVWMPLFDGLSGLPIVGSAFAFLQFSPLIAAGVLIAVAVKSRAHARATMPSDLIVTGDRVEIRGGPLHGTVLDRGELAALQLTETTREDRGFIEGLRDAYTDRQATESCLVLRAGTRALAEAVSPEEQRTVRAVHQMLTALARPEAAAPPAGRVVEEVVCTACGAPVSPDDRAEVACPACRAAVAIPQALRERVRVGRLATAASALRKRAVVAMTALPDARASGRRLRLLGWLMLLAWPVLLLAPAIAGFEMTVALIAALLAIGIGLDVAIYYAMLPRFVVRQAFPIALHQFAAREGAHDQACCRQCSAPLPPSHGTVVRCAFCATDNLLGRELVRALPTLSGEVSALEPAADAWGRDRRRTRISALLAAAILGGGVTAAALVVPGIRVRALTARCTHLDLDACEQLGAARWRPLLDDLCFGAPGDVLACIELGELETGFDDNLRVNVRRCALTHDADCPGAKLACMQHRDAPACAPYR